MQLLFPLSFPRGEDVYHTEIPLRKIKQRSVQIDEHADHEGERKIRDQVSMKEYYSSKLMIRLNEGNSYKVLDTQLNKNLCLL